MLKELKQKVYEENMALVKYGLVIFTWGNASGIDRHNNLVVIKPSGVPYDQMKADHMVVVDMEGKVLEGHLRPSSDLATHLVLYKAFENIGGIVHTHSLWATIWSQAGRSLPALGTTHADYFHGSVPCTRPLTEKEIQLNYEGNIGQVIVETFRGKDPLEIPGVLVNNHGPFTWGIHPEQAMQHAVILEEISKMAYYTLTLSPDTVLPANMLDKHFFRKHGDDAYYGQTDKMNNNKT